MTEIIVRTTCPDVEDERVVVLIQVTRGYEKQ